MNEQQLEKAIIEFSEYSSYTIDSIFQLYWDEFEQWCVQTNHRKNEG